MAGRGYRWVRTQRRVAAGSRGSTIVPEGGGAIMPAFEGVEGWRGYGGAKEI